jgi:hypothetical protein
MDILEQMEAELTRLVEVGREATADDEARLQRIMRGCAELLAEAADMSHQDIRNRLSQALREKVGAGLEQVDLWVRDVFDDHLVYELGGKSYQLDYTLDDKGAVTFGDPVEVVMKTVYEPVAESLAEANLPEKCYAYVPNKFKPATWKLPYLNADGSVDEKHLAAAAAAFSAGGSRGQKVEVPEKDVAAVKKKLAAAYRKLGKKPDEIPKQLLESGAGDQEGTESLTRITQLREGTKVAADGTVPIEIIRAGWGNKRDNHYYPQKMLERDCQVFKGNKMYIDHPTISDERQRPERSLRDIGGYVTSVDGVREGVVHGRAKIVQPWLRELINEAPQAVSLSIRANGVVNKGTVGGRAGNIVEAIPKSDSVDFVTEAGAGGRVAALFESARKGDEEMFETMTDEEILAALKEGKRHEGVLEQLREEAASDKKTVREGEDDGMPEDMKQLKEAKAKSDEDLVEAKRQISIRDTRDAVATALGETKLPEISRKKIREAFADKAYDKDEDREAAIKTAIEAETDYVKEIGGPAIKGMGMGSDTGGREKLKESFKARYLREGRSEEEAERMAEIASQGR